MFLHSGAGLHGHEFSSRPPSNVQQSPAHLRGPLLRSAFSHPKHRARTDADGMAAPPLRQRPASDYIPREPSPAVHFREPDDDPPPTPATLDEPISESELSDVTPSLDGAMSVSTATRRRRPRRLQRRGTNYYLGYPAPSIIGKTKVMQKVFLPRLLLQLQKVSEDGRSRPVLEVFPASRIAGPVVAPRLSKRFPGIFGVKRHLGYDDIVLVRRDDGNVSVDGDDSDNEDSLEIRNLLAVYSPLKHSDDAEIVLHDGSVWVAKPLASGSYDFVHTDAEGNTTTARWARRSVPAAAPASILRDAPGAPTMASHARYTFSILDPSTRRHPVLATLTPSTLNVQDTYTSVSASHARHPPITRIGRSLSTASSPPLSLATPYSPSMQSLSSSTSNGESDSAVHMPPSPDHVPTQRAAHRVDEATKMLISVSALWVALRSGWSHAYDSAAGGHQRAASPVSSTAGHRGRGRRNTWTTRSSTSDVPRPSELSGAEAGPRANGVFKRHSLPAQGPESAKTPCTPPPPTVSRSPTPSSTTSGGDAKPAPRRATSTGATFMRRRLEVSYSVLSPVAPETEAGGGAALEATRAGQQPPPQPYLLSPTQTPLDKAQAGSRTREAASGLKTAGKCAHKRDVEEQDRTAFDEGGSGRKKSSVRSRLSRWFHKLGPR